MPRKSLKYTEFQDEENTMWVITAMIVVVCLGVRAVSAEGPTASRSFC